MVFADTGWGGRCSTSRGECQSFKGRKRLLIDKHDSGIAVFFTEISRGSFVKSSKTCVVREQWRRGVEKQRDADRHELESFSSINMIPE